MRAVLIDDEEFENGVVVQRATLLGYLGLLPFLFTALVLWTSPWIVLPQSAGMIMQWEMYYAAIILSFMGGVRWGLAMMEPHIHAREHFTLQRLTGSVAPALIAWMALIPSAFIPLGDPSYAVRHTLILAAFLYLLVSDLQAVRDGAAPRWYGPLRRKLTFFLSLMLVLIILRLVLWHW